MTATTAFVCKAYSTVPFRPLQELGSPRCIIFANTAARARFGEPLPREEVEARFNSLPHSAQEFALGIFHALDHRLQVLTSDPLPGSGLCSKTQLKCFAMASLSISDASFLLRGRGWFYACWLLHSKTRQYVWPCRVAQSSCTCTYVSAGSCQELSPGQFLKMSTACCKSR